MDTTEKQETLTLELLAAIEQEEDITQRFLAKQLGVALGLANLYLKRCVRKGFIKMKHAPANRYAYYLTPKGFAEKSRLSAKFLSASFNFYNQVSHSFIDIYEQCSKNRKKKLAFAGFSELTEIAYVRAQEYDIQLVGIIDNALMQDQKLGLPVLSIKQAARSCDVCVITSFSISDKEYLHLCSHFEKHRIVLPTILGALPNKTSEH